MALSTLPSLQGLTEAGFFFSPLVLAQSSPQNTLEVVMPITCAALFPNVLTYLFPIFAIPLDTQPLLAVCPLPTPTRIHNCETHQLSSVKHIFFLPFLTPLSSRLLPSPLLACLRSPHDDLREQTHPTQFSSPLTVSAIFPPPTIVQGDKVVSDLLYQYFLFSTSLEEAEAFLRRTLPK